MFLEVSNFRGIVVYEVVLTATGNYYSIVNDYDNPARIFFAQANEVPVAQSEDAEGSA